MASVLKRKVEPVLAEQDQAPLTAQAPPEDFQPSRGKWWCPYCKTEQIFEMDSLLGVQRCPKCGISEKDYYVKSMNNLWDMGRKKR